MASSFPHTSCVVLFLFYVFFLCPKKNIPIDLSWYLTYPFFIYPWFGVDPRCRAQKQWYTHSIPTRPPSLFSWGGRFFFFQKLGIFFSLTALWVLACLCKRCFEERVCPVFLFFPQEFPQLFPPKKRGGGGEKAFVWVCVCIKEHLPPTGNNARTLHSCLFCFFLFLLFSENFTKPFFSSTSSQ